jgi:putative SOS response-associated peptidase YedK
MRYPRYRRVRAPLLGVAAEAAWLDPDVDLDAALELVRPLPDGLLDVYPLSTKINSSRVEGIELLTLLHG